MEINIGKNPLLFEIQCFGNISFWVKLIKCRKIIFEQHENFQKSGYRNRYQVLGANGVITLSIPVIGGRETKELTRQVKIDQNYKWQKNHWKTLESAYNKSPFFFHYSPGLKELFQKEYRLLWDFNLAAFEWVVRQLRIPIQTDFTESYEKLVQNEFVSDFRGIFKSSDRVNYNHSAYIQVFNKGFQQNLSILDILFNLGPESSSYLYHQTTI